MWHLAEIDSKNQENLTEKARDEVEIALGLSLEQRYIGWYEWLLENAENIESETKIPEDKIEPFDSETNNKIN